MVVNEVFNSDVIIIVVEDSCISLIWGEKKYKIYGFNLWIQPSHLPDSTDTFQCQY
jgi:hypothetical protein